MNDGKAGDKDDVICYCYDGDVDDECHLWWWWWRWLRVWTNEEHISGRVAPIVKEAEAPPAVCGDEEEKHDDDDD